MSSLGIETLFPLFLLFVFPSALHVLLRTSWAFNKCWMIKFTEGSSVFQANELWRHSIYYLPIWQDVTSTNPSQHLLLNFKGPSHSPQGERRGQSYIPILTGERNWYIKSVTVLCHGNPASQPGSRSQLGSRSGSKYQRRTCQNPSLLQDGSFSEEGGGSQHEIKCLAKHKGRLPNTVRSLHLTFREHSVHAINLHSASAHFTINTSDSLSWEVFFILINSMQNII